MEDATTARPTLRARGLAFDVAAMVALARELRFSDGGQQAFGLPAATATPVVLGDFVGDTRQGGSVNCATVTLHPHGDGTHTETAAHVEYGAPLLCDLGGVVSGVAVVAMVRGERLTDTGESYPGPHDKDDVVLTLAALESALALVERLPACCALVVGRTEREPTNAYFTHEAMTAIAKSRIQHILCEEQSVDRLDDGGQLANHRCYFQLEPRGAQQAHLDEKRRTITEMIAPLHERFPPGTHGAWLHLPLPRWETDAAPSAPVLFPALSAGGLSDD